VTESHIPKQGINESEMKMRLNIQLTMLLGCFLLCVTAHATPLVVDPGGILTGATGVLVDGHLYNVQSVDGMCTQVFGVM